MQNGNKFNNFKRAFWYVLFAGVILLSVLHLTKADPNGAVMSFNSTGTTSTAPAPQLNDSGGTITTIVISTTQQDSAWKGYVGNVSGLLTLDDALQNTLYNWQLAIVAGEVYATRASSTITWGSINCSNQTHVDSEQTALAFSSSDGDSINGTFNSTLHRSFIVASRNMSSCRSTALFVNDSRQGQVSDALFQEILLSDGSNNVYASIINNDQQGFRNVENATYDFQMIVPQSKVSAVPTSYYFYIELG